MDKKIPSISHAGSESGKHLFEEVRVTLGVPQGSVLGTFILLLLLLLLVLRK
jgi:hypothetical protein